MKLSKSHSYVQDVHSQRWEGTDVGLSGNGAPAWAQCHVAIWCWDPPLTLDAGLGLWEQGVSLPNGPHMLGTEGLIGSREGAVTEGGRETRWKLHGGWNKAQCNYFTFTQGAALILSDSNQEMCKCLYLCLFVFSLTRNWCVLETVSDVDSELHLIFEPVDCVAFWNLQSSDELCFLVCLSGSEAGTATSLAAKTAAQKSL